MIELAASALDKHDSSQDDVTNVPYSTDNITANIGAVTVGLLIGINQDIGSNKVSNILLNIRIAALNICLLQLV